MFLLTYTLDIKAGQILQQKVISNQVNDWDMHWTKIIFDNNDNVLITMKGFFYTVDNLRSTRNLSEYCCDVLGGYIKDDQFYIILNDIHKIDVYKIQKQVELESYIKPKISEYHDYDGIVLIPGENDFYYLFGHYNLLTSKPIDNLKMMISAGSVTFKKPFLAKIQNNKIVHCIKLDYGGKRDESYIVQEAVAGKDSIHLFGFRNIDVPFIGDGVREPIRLIDSGTNGYALKMHQFKRGDYYQDRNITRSITLYYTDYNLKKMKNMRNSLIYENTPGFNHDTDIYSDYGVLSADTKDDCVYAVFNWVEQKHFKQGGKFRQAFDINNVNSSIYYWRCGDKPYGKAEKIAEGFCPLLRVDQFGSVHVFWIDRSGNVVHKIQKGSNWGNDEIILKGINSKPIICTKFSYSVLDRDRPEAILYTKFLAAEFDKENILHAVYPTSEGIVYTKLKLE